jgi:hypothetical protein
VIDGRVFQRLDTNGNGITTRAKARNFDEKRTPDDAVGGAASHGVAPGGADPFGKAQDAPRLQ